MATIKVTCPICGTEDVVRHGTLPKGEQRFRCRNTDCTKNAFILNYTSLGRQPGIANKIIDMAMNASDTRDTARVLGISPATVIGTLKGQEERLSQVNAAFHRSLCPKQAQVKIARVEVVEMWDFVGSKDKVFKRLKTQLKPFGPRRFCTDAW